jgi:hypothetical protein
MSVMRAIPVTLVEEDVHIHVRGKIDIGPGDDKHRGRSRNNKRGWRGHVDPDIDVHSGRAFVEGTHQRQKRCSSQ